MSLPSSPCECTTDTGLILVVDDQETNLQVVANVLSGAGFEMVPANSGAQALQRIAARLPDLILLDLLMPDMDGFEVCRRIQENPDWAKLPIIFVSAADAAERLLQFVAEFLANASADHGLCVSLVPVDLAMAANSTARSFGYFARRKRIAIQCDIPAQPVMTQADTSCVEQVLENLLSNALKFSPHGKSIWVKVTMGETEAFCSITDEGPGFTPEDQRRMFRRYGRLSARPTGEEPSTGLGLSIVKKLMDAMGGKLLCESTPGQGATLTIVLPRSAHVQP